MVIIPVVMAPVLVHGLVNDTSSNAEVIYCQIAIDVWLNFDKTKYPRKNIRLVHNILCIEGNE